MARTGSFYYKGRTYEWMWFDIEGKSVNDEHDDQFSLSIHDPSPFEYVRQQVHGPIRDGLKTYVKNGPYSDMDIVEFLDKLGV